MDRVIFDTYRPAIVQAIKDNDTLDGIINHLPEMTNDEQMHYVSLANTLSEDARKFVNRTAFVTFSSTNPVHRLIELSLNAIDQSEDE